MHKTLLIVLAVFFVPASVRAVGPGAPASFKAGQSLVATSSSPGNAYAAGMSVVLTAPVEGDFSVLAGSVITAAPVKGDDLIFAGSISSRASVAGDLRAVGGNIAVTQSVAGDLFAAGFSVSDSGRVGGSVFIVGANITLGNGAAGPVTIYGNNVALAGIFDTDVTVVSSGRVSLAPGTVIHGAFSYQSPEMAVIPASVVVDGGVAYTNASYLPDPGTSHMLAFLSIGFFIIARIIGALILAGLFAGLFPVFAQSVIDEIVVMRPRDALLTFLLGFALFVATPIAIMFLMLTFVGIGLALLLFLLYALVVFLALIYTGVFIGGSIIRRFTGREQVLWHDGVLGAAVLSLVALVPFIGIWIVSILTAFSLGTLLQKFFSFAFPHGKSESDID